MRQLYLYKTGNDGRPPTITSFRMGRRLDHALIFLPGLSDMLIRKHKLGVLRHLLNRVVAAHTAVCIWFAIDNDVLKVGAADVASHIMQLRAGYLRP